LISKLDAVRENERMRISRDIHDELGQTLTAIKFDFDFFRLNFRKELNKTGCPDNPELNRRLESLGKMINSVIKSVRTISSDIRIGYLEELGFVDSLKWYLSDFKERTGIKVKASIAPEYLYSERKNKIAAFRIFQEIMTNIARHSKASKVFVKLFKTGSSSGRTVILKVRDNGTGIPEKILEDKNSIGIIGMKERAVLLGGVISFTNLKQGGTEVILKFPGTEKK